MSGTHIGCAIAIASCLALHPSIAGSIDIESGIDPTEQIAPNDNRIPAGTLANGVLTLHLEARTGRWFPDGDQQPSVSVSAFGIEGGPLQTPGPLIRVPAGTEIRVDVRNRLSEAFAVHGLYSRPAVEPDAPVGVPAGEARQFRFMAEEPGTYFYWASGAADGTIQQQRDTLLSGALVVDPRDGATAPDRVLVIEHWTNGVRNAIGGRVAESRRRFVINGLSWPHTERLSHGVGDVVHMRVINVSAGVHPMHLHGFYFNVDSRGDERHDELFPADSSPHLVVTERLDIGRTFTMTWKPTRPGNWLFHCHDAAHLDYGGRLDTTGPEPADLHHHVTNHALEMMAGPVLGITVTGKSAEAPARGARRSLRLVARVDDGSTSAEPAYAYALDGEHATSKPPSAIGPTLILKRGEPVAITIANQLPEETSVHWHGIELESYFDGVPGFAGDGQHIAPPVPPGGSFVARFTPPRSGTFIYHAHVDDTRQQQAGLSGPLLIVDDPRRFDPEHDVVLMVTTPRQNPQQNVVFINGSAAPSPREMHVDQHYRLRLINLHVARPSMRMRLLRGDTLLPWRALAKDGMDLPDDRRTEGRAEVQMGNGETYDFDFEPREAGYLRFDVTNAGGVLLASMPIHVTEIART